jgi:hypothetical protein
MLNTMPRNKFIDDEVYCSDDDRSKSGEQYTDSYEENDDFINDSMTEGEENEIYDVHVYGNSDQYCDEEVGNDDDALGFSEISMNGMVVFLTNGI